MRRKVVAFANLPVTLRTPLLYSVVAELEMHRLSSPGWVKGVVWTLLGLLWVVTIVTLLHQDYLTPRWEEER